MFAPNYTCFLLGHGATSLSVATLPSGTLQWRATTSIASKPVGWRPFLLGWRPSLLGWRPRGLFCAKRCGCGDCGGCGVPAPNATVPTKPSLSAPRLLARYEQFLSALLLTRYCRTCRVSKQRRRPSSLADGKRGVDRTWAGGGTRAFAHFTSTIDQPGAKELANLCKASRDTDLILSTNVATLYIQTLTQHPKAYTAQTHVKLSETRQSNKKLLETSASLLVTVKGPSQSRISGPRGIGLL